MWYKGEDAARTRIFNQFTSKRLNSFIHLIE